MAQKISHGQKRLFMLILMGIVGSVLVGILPHQFITYYKITELASIATIIASSFTILGAIFTAVYKEISSYYKDKSESSQKRWELVFPMIKENYMPWITSAHSLADSFGRSSNGTPTDGQLNRVGFLLALFYGIRLQNLQKNGGYILLSSPEDEEEVNKAYHEVKDVLNWAGEDTPNLANKLAEVFVSNESTEKPYSLSRFEKDLKTDEIVQKSMSALKNWITSEKANNAKEKLTTFENVFKEKINELSSTWNK